MGVQTPPEALRRNIGAQQFRLSDGHPGVQDGVFPLQRNIPRVGLLAVGRKHRDLPAQMLFVEAERRPAVAAGVSASIA
jgi:hypothetical protein